MDDTTSTFIDGIQYDRILNGGQGCHIISGDLMQVCAFFDRDNNKCTAVNCFVDGKNYIFVEGV